MSRDGVKGRVRPRAASRTQKRQKLFALLIGDDALYILFKDRERHAARKRERLFRVIDVLMFQPGKRLGMRGHIGP